MARHDGHGGDDGAGLSKLVSLFGAITVLFYFLVKKEKKGKRLELYRANVGLPFFMVFIFASYPRVSFVLIFWRWCFV